MRVLSLRFYQDDHEGEYQALNMKINMKSFQRNFIFYAVLSIMISIYSFFFNMWQEGVLGLAYAASIPLMYQVGKKGSLNFDLTCFAFQVSQNLVSPMVYLLGIVSGPISDSQSYLIGQGVTYLVQSSNLGSRFYLKVATIIINLLIQLYVKLLVQKELTILTLFYIGSNFMLMNYIYRQDRIQREAFLLKNNEQLCQNEIGKCAQISMITCISENGHLLLNLLRFNQTSQNEFNISSMDSQKIFLNSVKMIEKKYFSTRLLNNLKHNQKSNKVLSLYTWISRYSEQSQSEKSQFIGLYNSCQYDVKIFTTWNDQQLIIHTLITKCQIKTEGENSTILQFERQLFSNYRDKMSKQIKSIFVHLKLNGQKQNDCPQKNSQLMSVVCNSLRLTYNYQLYIKPQYEITCNHFLLLPLITEINQTIRHITPKPYIIGTQFFMDPYLKLFSCKKTIYQILLNLHSIIVLSAKQSGYIRLSIQQRQTLIGSQITFCIITNVTSIKCITETQNHQRNDNGNYLHLLVDGKKVGLEVVVSEFLVGKIGPFRRIKMIESYQANPMIQFKIYQDLSILGQ